ncbi:MAG: SH3 domain-containing protein [Deltaproteobacteria bacterium]|uniref:SH3 domain-containing protein n=1 Tax=Candidatus Zymogenus saltonus TaxID=2844893 RepID=A0A9D8KEB0_9DELT|nr:SH3 domain-containing protein [Candidatus Zymogenus saltonus]
MKRNLFISVFAFFLLAVIATAVITPQAHAQRDDYIYIRTPDAYLLSGPGTEYRILCKITRSDPLIVIYWRGDWFQVEKVDGTQGWINRVVLNSHDSEKYPVYITETPNRTNESVLDRLKHGFKGSGDGSITASAGGRGIDESDGSGGYYKDFESVGFMESIVIPDYEIQNFINAGGLNR